MILSGLLSLLPLSARAQHQAENTNWNFGNFRGLRFSASGPTVTTDSQMSSHEAVSTISDAQGNLLLYTNSTTVWDRTNTPLPSTFGAAGELKGNRSTTQGALFVKDPAPGSSLYYLFTLGTTDLGRYEALHYTVLDMTLRNSLGDVVPGRKNVPLPVPAPNVLTEKMVGVRHNNGRDTWVIVHGRDNDAFYSFLVTPDGVSTVPVVSHVGRVHNEAVGEMKVSPDGRHLALGIAFTLNAAELLDFSNATGQVSNALPLNSGSAWNYGVEFSPDNSKLYVYRFTNLADPNAYFGIRQYNLLASSRAAIVSTAVDLPFALNTSTPLLNSMELGPNGKIYISRGASSPTVGIINNPNALGAACNLVSSAPLLGNLANTGNFQNFVRVPPIRQPELLIMAPEICHGSSGTFTATLTLPLPLSNSRWNFGDPASGAANTAMGLTASHVFSAPGSYIVRLEADVSTGGTPPTQQLSATHTVVVRPGPVVRLSPAPDTSACLDKPLLLRVNAQPAGTTYRWQDGSTASTYAVEQEGRYAVEVSREGCTVRAEIAVRTTCEPLIPNIITPNNDGANDQLVLKGLNAGQWSITIFNRWGRQVYSQESYTNTWSASGQPNGLYYYLLSRRSDGHRVRGYVEVLR